MFAKIEDHQRYLSRKTHLTEHDAPDGLHVKRYSPSGFDTPVWSDVDISRPDRRKFYGGKGPRAGHVRLIDRRKPWQKSGLSCARFDITGVYVTLKNKPKD